MGGHAFPSFPNWLESSGELQLVIGNGIIIDNCSHPLEKNTMSVQVVGISGSPIPNSNTDRAVRRILEFTGLSSQFVKLSDLDLAPCRACLGCVETNKCVVQDDGQALAELFHGASAFVLGGYTPYSSLDARSKAFMERMYCHRHRIGGNARKFGVAVITTACPPGVQGMPPAAETATSQIGFWMMEEGMTNLGTMVIQGNVPCIRCGHGDDCSMSGIKMLYGPEATIASVGVKTLEEDTALLSMAEELAKKLREAVIGQSAS
jgi:multimeric flavodoxin WrbA